MKAGQSGEIVDLAGYADARKSAQQQQMKHDSFVECQCNYTWHQGSIPQVRIEIQGATAHHNVTRERISHCDEKQISGLRRLDFSLNSDQIATLTTIKPPAIKARNWGAT